MAVKLIEPAHDAVEVREFPVTGEEFLIGRGTDCDLRLGVSDISRHHCLIRFSSGAAAGKVEAVLSDLGSSNGTYVNGQRVRSQILLHTGDEIRVGPCRFLVDLGDVPLDVNAVPGVDPNAATARVKATPGPRKPS